MHRTLIILVLAIIVLCWNFIFTEKKVGLTDEAKVLQGLSTALAYKTAVANYYRQHGGLPGRQEWLAQQPPVSVDLGHSLASSIEVGTDGPGVISVHYTARTGVKSPELINGKKINLIPVINNGQIDWTCKGTMDRKFLPKDCSPL